MAGALGWDDLMLRHDRTARAELRLGPVPSDDPQRLGQYLRPATLLSASAGTEQPAAAARLISFMINDPEVGAIFGANRGLPVTVTQRAAVRLTGPPAAVAAYQESLGSQLDPAPAPPPKGAGALEQALIRIVEDLLSDRIDVGEAVDQFFAEAGERLQP